MCLAMPLLSRPRAPSLISLISFAFHVLQARPPLSLSSSKQEVSAWLDWCCGELEVDPSKVESLRNTAFLGLSKEDMASITEDRKLAILLVGERNLACTFLAPARPL